ncbi:hypothetical protein JCM11641_000979 [Rhodosporidiobolus odoratus]
MPSIAIIGAGIIGSSTAYQLATLLHQRNKANDTTITLIEGSFIAAGASGKAGGLLALDWHGPDTANLAALSYNLHASLASEHSGASRWGYRKLDTLSISADLSSSSASSSPAAKPRASKLKHADLFPWLNKDVLRGSEVLGSTDTTSQVHPEQFTKAMVELAQEKGVKVVYGTVEGLTKPASLGAEPYTLTISSRDDPNSTSTLSADQIVVCAGPWTGQLLETLGIEDRAAGRAKAIRGSRAHSVVLKTAQGRELPAQAVFTSIKTKGGHAEPEIYNRPDGTSYCCGPTDSSPLPTHASQVTTSPTSISQLLHQTAQLAPRYLDTENKEEGGKYKATVEREQACFLPVESGDPVIGRVEGEGGRGVWVGSGHSCWGICNGPGTGLVLAEMLLDGKAKSANVDALAP